MGRKSNEYLNKIKEKYNVDMIYSWSRYKKYKDSMYEYLLKYIEKVTPDRNGTSIYGVSGSTCHDLLEKFYLQELEYKDLILGYEESLFNMDMAGMKYDRMDEDKNNVIADKYENSIRHYFNNFIPIDRKVALEKFVTIKVGKYIFQGYIDCVFKEEDGVYYILDFKTSSIYTGAKLQNELRQLFLYTEALVQLGIPLENIRCGYDFLKYVNVAYEQKNGKLKNRNVIRRDFVQEVSVPIKMWLNHFKYEDDKIEEFLIKAVENNSLDSLPEEVKAKFKTSNAYVWIKPEQEDLDDLKRNIIDKLDELNEKLLEYNETKDDKLFYDIVTDKDSYYYYNLSEYSRKINPCWNIFLENIELFKEDLDSDKNSDEDFIF